MRRRPPDRRAQDERPWSKFLNLVFSGLVTGAIYSIMASGLVLTYTTSGIFNFAHGAVAFATAYLYYQLNTGLGVPIVPALIISVFIFAPLLGLAARPHPAAAAGDGAGVRARIVGTIGLLVVLPALVQWLVVTVGNDVLDLGLQGNDAVTEGVPVPGIGPTPHAQLQPIAGRGAQLRSDRGVHRRRDRRGRALVRHPAHPRRARDARGRRPRIARRPARRRTRPGPRRWRGS